MAKYRINTAFTRMKAVPGSPPERQDFPAGSVIEPTNAEFQAFGDLMERIDDSTPLTAVATPTATSDPEAPYDPDAAPAAADAPAPAPPAPPPDEPPTETTTRRR